MRDKIRLTFLAIAGLMALTGLTAGVADAAGHNHAKRHHARRHSAARQSTASSTDTSSDAADPRGNPNETELTGDTKTSAENAALAAVPGGTVMHSSTEDPNDPSGAAYEVHVTKADGSRVEVLEDSSFTVLSTKADTGCHGGHPPDGADAGQQQGS